MEVSGRELGFCSFLQTVMFLTFRVGALLFCCCIRLGAQWGGLHHVLVSALWGFGAARLLGCFVTIRVLVLLEGQQVGLLLLQLSLELLGLTLLLELPPFILLSAGSVKFNQNPRYLNSFWDPQTFRPAAGNLETHVQLIFMREMH